MSLREKYLSTVPGNLGTVEVAGWGKVYIRSLTISELKIAQELADGDKAKKIEGDQLKSMIFVFLKAVVDHEGGRVFNDGDESAIEAIGISTVTSVAGKIFKHSMPVTDVAEVEDAKKNSEKTPALSS